MAIELTPSSLERAFDICIKKYLQMEGRSGRVEFWNIFVLYLLINIVAALCDCIFGSDVDKIFGINKGVHIISSITWMVTIFPYISACSRRLHDKGYSAWVFFICSAGFWVGLAAVGLHSTDGAGTIGLIISCGSIIYLMCLLAQRGDSHDNKYGKSPALSLISQADRTAQQPHGFSPTPASGLPLVGSNEAASSNHDSFDVAGEEALSGRVKPGLWARALTEAENDELAVKGAYVKLRVADLEVQAATQAERERKALAVNAGLVECAAGGASDVRYQFSPMALSVYGEDQLKKMADLSCILRDNCKSKLLAAHEAICRKIGCDAGKGDERAFLEAYYSQASRLLQKESEFFYEFNLTAIRPKKKYGIGPYLVCAVLIGVVVGVSSVSLGDEKRTVPPQPAVPAALSEIAYSDCTAARAAGAGPFYRGDMRYRLELDTNLDGIACGPGDQ